MQPAYQRGNAIETALEHIAFALDAYRFHSQDVGNMALQVRAHMGNPWSMQPREGLHSDLIFKAWTSTVKMIAVWKNHSPVPSPAPIIKVYHAASGALEQTVSLPGMRNMRLGSACKANATRTLLSLQIIRCLLWHTRTLVLATTRSYGLLICYLAMSALRNSWMTVI